MGALMVYIGCIFTANWMLQTYGFLPVGWGYEAPAGVFAVGLAFTARDIVQDILGKRAVLVAIVIGAGCSWLVASSFAGPSLVAFLLSELADFAVYTPLHERRWLTAVALSNVAGDVIDSCVFLWLAFGSLAFIEGQLIGKYEVTLALLPILWLWRRYVLPERRHPAGIQASAVGSDGHTGHGEPDPAGGVLGNG